MGEIWFSPTPPLSLRRTLSQERTQRTDSTIVVAGSGLAGENEIIARSSFLIALLEPCVLVAQDFHEEIDTLRFEVFICTQVKSNRL